MKLKNLLRVALLPFLVLATSAAHADNTSGLFTSAVNSTTSYLSGNLGTNSTQSSTTTSGLFGGTVTSSSTSALTTSGTGATSSFLTSSTTTSAGDPCANLNSTLAATQQQRSTELMPDDAPYNATQASGADSIMSTAAGTDPIADAIVSKLAQVLVNYLMSKGQAYLNSALSSLTAKTGASFSLTTLQSVANGAGVTAGIGNSSGTAGVNFGTAGVNGGVTNPSGAAGASFTSGATGTTVTTINGAAGH